MRLIAGFASGVAGLSLSFSALAQEATLEFQAESDEGSVITVTWTGPDAAGDFLTIALPDSGAGEFLSYVRTSAGIPVEFEAPAIGEYELRYVHASDLTILSRAPLIIVPPNLAASLTAPPKAIAGTEIAIEVADAGEPADYVTIVVVQSPDDAFGPYARLQGRNEVMLDVPAEAGSYEIRQVRAAGQIVLNRLALTVEPAAVKPQQSAMATDGEPVNAETSAVQAIEVSVDDEPEAPATQSTRVELMALVAVDPAKEFGVALSGPVDADARLVIVAQGEKTLGDGMAVGPERILRITAPANSGMYEIRLLDSGSGAVITSRLLEVR